MPLRDDLLTPIPGDNPGGVDLRYDPVYDKIKDARREDDDAPQGEWSTERKVADWPVVIKLAGEAIATKSKDLQLAAWLTEALLRKESVSGLRDGLTLLHGLLDQFWDHLFPEIEDDDYEMRAAPLEWVGRKLDVALNLAPLTRTGYGVLQYREGRAVGYEITDEYDNAGKEARATAIAEGKLSAEEWDRAFDATPKAWYKTLVADLDASVERLEALDAIGRDKFGPDAPTYGPLREALKDVQRTAKQILAVKLEKDPDPVEADAGLSLDAPADGGAGAATTATTLTVEPASREDAAARLSGVARWLRRTEPTNPAAYLMLRGFRWGELRASGTDPDPRLLEAPQTHVRTQLKSLLLDGRWPELLETAETIMGSTYGRGWLDLQRYVMTALDGLGADYAPVATALLGALRGLLIDIPALPDLTLMDDTPTANAETRAWLRKSVVAGMPAAARLAPVDDRPTVARGPARPTADPFARALAEARAGRASRGIEMVSRALAGETSKRGRFVRQTQLAAVMIEGTLDALARPLLDDLLAMADAFKLDDWDEPRIVSRPLALLWRSLDRAQTEEELKQALYLRIARIDPIVALALSSPAAVPAYEEPAYEASTYEETPYEESTGYDDSSYGSTSDETTSDAVEEV